MPIHIIGELDIESRNMLKSALGDKAYYTLMQVSEVGANVSALASLLNYRLVENAMYAGTPKVEKMKTGGSKAGIKTEPVNQVLPERTVTGETGCGKSIETSYGKSSLNSLKNTEKFTDSAIEHIFEGNVRRGKAGGYHYECIENTAGNVVHGTEVSVNDFGVYKAQVEANGIPKLGNGGYSTFFPKNMSPQEIIDAINEAYSNKIFKIGSRNTYIGTSKNGMEIEMYIKDGKIISAFPKE